VGGWLASNLARLIDDQPLCQPFAAGEAFHELAAHWNDARSGSRLLKPVDAALSSMRVVGVACDGLSNHFHCAILGTESARKGQHWLVYQPDPLLRLADHWTSDGVPLVPAVRGAERRGMNGLALVHALLKAEGLPMHVVSLRELADASAAGDAAWQALFSLRGHGRQLIGWEATRSELSQRQSDLSAMLSAERLVDVRNEACWLTGLQQRPGFLAPVVKPVSIDSVYLRLDEMPSMVTENEPVRCSGVLVPDGVPSPNRILSAAQGERLLSLTWNQPSPAVAARLPEKQAAHMARFKPVMLRVKRREPIELLFQRDASAPATCAARIRFEPVSHEPVRGIYVAAWDVGYHPIPKAACTSVKMWLFQLATGQAFSPARAAGAQHVHVYFDKRLADVGSAGFRFVIVRDPIKRFLSAYANRVVHHRELSRRYLESRAADAGLSLERFPFDPSLDDFIERFAFYRRIPTIQHHFRPVSEFMAPLSSFHRVYPIEQVNQLVVDLRQHTGLKLAELPREQVAKSGSPIGLSTRSFDRLVALLEPDYRLLADYYTISTEHRLQ
jgi:hypothetical protein